MTTMDKIMGIAMVAVAALTVGILVSGFSRMVMSKMYETPFLGCAEKPINKMCSAVLRCDVGTELVLQDGIRPICINIKD